MLMEGVKRKVFPTKRACHHCQVISKSSTATDFQSLNMESIMEDMYRHHFVNCSNDEIMSITRSTKTLVKRCLRAFRSNSKLSRNLGKLYCAGSMAEDTRVWDFIELNNHGRIPVLEFDFLVSVENELYSAIKACDGHVKIFNTTDNSSKGEYVDPTAISESFRDELSFAVANICRCNFSYQSRVINDSHASCKKCCVRETSGHLAIVLDKSIHLKCSLVFLWSSRHRSIIAKDCIQQDCEPEILETILVLVDLLPTYHINDSLPSTFVVPKKCYNCEDSICWRLSRSVEEVTVVRESTPHHRRVYMAIKVFANISFRETNVISSYILKTAFLQHVNGCYGNNANELECLSNVFDILSSAFQQKSLPSYFFRYNLLEKFRLEVNGFFRQWSLNFENLKILVVDNVFVLGERDISIGRMHPYLRKIPTMTGSLYQRHERLSHKRRAVAEVMRSLQFIDQDGARNNDQSYILSNDQYEDTNDDSLQQAAYSNEQIRAMSATSVITMIDSLTDVSSEAYESSLREESHVSEENQSIEIYNRGHSVADQSIEIYNQRRYGTDGDDNLIAGQFLHGRQFFRPQSQAWLGNISIVDGIYTLVPPRYFVRGNVDTFSMGHVNRPSKSCVVL